MDDFSDILRPDAVVSGWQAQTKRAMFTQLAARGAELTGFPAADLLEQVEARERLSSTGFGGGIAIPHGKVVGLSQVTGLFVRLGAPLEWKAIDAAPVDLVFLLLSPAEGGVDHLKALARVSRRMRDRTFVAKLRGAGSPDALYALFAGGDQRDAA